MIRKVFEWRRDEMYDLYGWGQVTQPTFNVCDGRMIAHDVMEHGTRDLPDLTSELLAFGAIINIRALGGYFYDFTYGNNGAKGIGGELVDFALEHLDYKHTDFPSETLRNVGSPPKNFDSEYEDAANFIASAIRYAKEPSLIDSELDSYDLGGGESGSERREKVLKVIDQFANYLKIGYVKSVNRYCQNSPEELCYTFQQIKQRIEDKYKAGDIGDRISVGVDRKTLKVDIHYVSPRY